MDKKMENERKLELECVLCLGVAVFKWLVYVR